MIEIKISPWVSFAGKFVRKRRANPRIPCNHLVRYYDPYCDMPQHTSNAVNLSENGMQFFARKRIKKGTLLNLEINLVEKHQVIYADAKVIWIKSVPARYKAYRVGVCFQEISEEHRRLLADLVLQKKLFL